MATFSTGPVSAQVALSHTVTSGWTMGV